VLLTVAGGPVFSPWGLFFGCFLFFFFFGG